MAAAAFGVLGLPLGNVAAAGASPATLKQAMVSYLRSQLRQPPLPPDKTTKYAYAVIDLPGSSAKEVIVYVTGASWCGSGGCTLLMLRFNGTSFTQLGNVTIVWPPIYQAEAVTNGYPDIAVSVSGGGILHPYVARLRYDGTAYPSNPSVPPAMPVRGKLAGKELIGISAPESPLY